MKEQSYKPDHAHTLSTYLIIFEVDKCLTFLQEVFDTKVLGTLYRPNGSIMHAEVLVGDSLLMLGEPMGGYGPRPAAIFVYLPDPESAYAKALDCGGQVLMEMREQPHAGVKYGGVQDPFGNHWWIGKRTEGLSWEEQQRRIDTVPTTWSSDGEV